MARRKTEKPTPEVAPEAPTADDAPVVVDDADEDTDVVAEPDAVAVVDILVEDDDDDDDDDEDDVVAPVVARPVARPSPGRPPSAKEEPEPPFNIGEKVRLTSNTRPRTGSPIGEHPVGAEGRVETVLSLTAIIRFNSTPDQKEVVAFTCLETLEPEAEAKRVRDRKEKEKQAKLAAAEAAKK